VSWVLVARKELVVEMRSRETLVPLLLVGLLVVGVGLLAFHDVADRAPVAAGVVWLALAFAAAVGMARAFGAEKDRGTLDVLLGLPVDRGHVYLGKVASAFVTLLVVGVVTVAAYALASREMDGADWPALALVLALGALGLAATSVMLSLLAAQTRARDALLPVLLLPLLVPLLLAGTEGTQEALARAPWSAWSGELYLLVGYDVAFLAASWLLFDAAVGA
jgi:heme exporter protein B